MIRNITVLFKISMLKLYIALEHLLGIDWILPKYAKSVVYF